MSSKMSELKIGDKYGKLTITSFTRNESGYVYCNCICDCGNKKSVRRDHLINGKIISCGCWRKYKASIVTGNRLKHGKSRTRLYKVLRDMKTRCYNSNSPDYPRYGGRGITICKEWLSDFEKFEKWAIENGYDETAPKMQCTIDRIDNNKGYSPDNCRFISVAEQNRNKTNRKSKYGKEWLEKIRPYANLKRREVAERLNLKEMEVKYILRLYHTTLKELQEGAE